MRLCHHWAQKGVPFLQVVLAFGGASFISALAPLPGMTALFLSFACLLQTLAEPATPQDVTPFLHFRDFTLGYTGPDHTSTNLAEICIGWFGPTNVNDPLTGDLWWAANLAVQEANAQRLAQPDSSVPSLPFRLVPRWATNPWGTGVSQLARMIYEEQPLALLGSVDSAATHLAEQVVAKANLPLVSPIVTDKSVTLAGVSWVFACAPSDAAIASVLVDDILAAQPDPRDRLALLTCTDHESRMTTKEVIRRFTQRRRLPDFHFEVPPGVHDVARQLAALAECDPAAILIIAGAEDAARLVLAVRERQPAAQALPADPSRGPACPIFGSQAMGRRRFRQLAGGAAID